MKIFHNFDTQLKKKDYLWAVNSVWKNKVILVERSFYYWLLKWIFPLTISMIINILVIISFFRFLDNNLIPLAWIILFIWAFLFMWWLMIIINHYIKYKLDFSIITSDEIITHSQKGIFNRKYKNIPSKKIRSIQSQHTWFWWNLLNYGSITLLIDGGLGAVGDEKDGSGSGKVVFTYVYKPNFTRRQIMGLCFHNKTLDDKCMTSEALLEEMIKTKKETNKENLKDWKKWNSGKK